MPYQWSDEVAPEVEYDITEESELLIFNVPTGNEKFADLKLSTLKPADRAFFDSLDGDTGLTLEESTKKQIDWFCREWNGKPYTGLSGNAETIEALKSVLLLCRPKAYQPVKATLVQVPVGLKPRVWQWNDELPPKCYYQLNADYSLSVWNVPESDRLIEVKLRPLTEKDRSWFSQITTSPGTLDEQSAKLISGLCVGWGEDTTVSEEALILNPDAVGAIDRVMAVCFPKSFRPVKRRSRGFSGDSLQAQ